MKSVKNFRYVQKTSAECNEDSYLAILHLSRVELHCKLQEKLHRVTWPLFHTCFIYIFCIICCGFLGICINMFNPSNWFIFCHVIASIFTNLFYGACYFYITYNN